jgi:hypothetical protein
MTSELETLRSVADRVRRPAFEALEEVARRRTRRTAATVVVGCMLTVVAIAGGIVVATARDDRSAPEPIITPSPTPTSTPSPTPTPEPSPTHLSDTSMTPEEVVLADDALLQMTGVSLDDPDFRVSLWTATCHRCPKSPDARFKPSFGALAITTDGFETATYRRPPFDSGLEHVESVGPGLLVIVDVANGYEWLVRDDGTVTPLERDFDEVPAADPRRWFVCLGNTGRTGPGGQATPFDAQPTWCALEPKTNTVHIWEGPWVGTLDDSESMVSPGSGEMPWGVRDPTYGPTRPMPADDRVEAWWEVDGTRHREDLGPATASGPVLNGPPGLMSCWAWVKGSPTLTVFTSSDQGPSWQTTELATPFRPPYFLTVSWTPGGDLVGRQNNAFYPDGSDNEGDGLRLWRASLAEGGTFEVVYESRSGNAINWENPAFTVLDGRIWSSGFWSDDDGRTWTEVSIWR